MANETTQLETKPEVKTGKAYFHKHGVNNKVPRPNGTSFKFERLVDSQGVIALDPDADNGANKGDIDAAIAELRGFIKRGIYGLSEVKEDFYEGLKKNLALPASPAPLPSSVRVFSPASPFKDEPLKSAQPAAASVFVHPAADAKSAESAGAQESSSPSAAPAKQPRVGKPKVAQSRPPAQPPASDILNPPPAG